MTDRPEGAHEGEQVLGVLTGQVPLSGPVGKMGRKRAEPPDCPDHREVQHRDRKPPWCDSCGWTHGQSAVSPSRLGDPK